MAEDFDGDGVVDLLVVGRATSCGAQCPSGMVSVRLLLRGGVGNNALRFAEAERVQWDAVAVATVRLAPDEVPGLVAIASVGTSTTGPATFEYVANLGNGTFVSRSEVMVPTFPYANMDRIMAAVAVFDVNGDAHDDVYVHDGETFFAPAVAMYVNMLNGTFIDRVVSLFGSVNNAPKTRQTGPLVADLLGNGRICIFDITALNPAVWIQRPDGTFGGPSLTYDQTGLDNMMSHRSFAVGDFNNDTRLDIVSSGSFAGVSTLFQYDGYGNGSFAPRVPPGGALPVNGVLHSILAHDLDGNGWPDLVITSDYLVGGPNSDSMAVFNDGGNWTRSTRLLPFGPGYGVAYDVDGSTFLLVAGEDLPRDDSVYTGLVVGSNLSPLGGSVFVGTGAIATLIDGDVGIADVYGDACPDLVMCGNTPARDLYTTDSYGCTLLLGNCNGAFTDTVDVDLRPLGLPSILIADYDLDGRDDVLIVGYDYVPRTGGVEYHLSSLGFARNREALISAVANMLVPTFASAADWSGDGAVDVLLLQYDAAYTLAFLENLGNGSFVNRNATPAPDLPYGPSYEGHTVVWGDLSNVGRPSLLYVAFVGTCVYVNHGNGSLSCDADVLPASAPAWDRYAHFLISDFDGDGAQDLLVVGGVNETLLAFGDAGNNTLVAAPRSAVPLPYESRVAGVSGLRTGPAAIDLDHAGGMDVLLGVGSWPNGVFKPTALLGGRTLNVTTAAAFAPAFASSSEGSFTVADIDGDGWDDAVATDAGLWCAQPPVLLRRDQLPVSPSTTSSGSSGGSNDGASASGSSSSLWAAIGGIVGGGVVMLALMAMLCAAIVCCCACIFMLLVAIVVVVALATVVVIVVVAVAGTGIAFVGGGGGVALKVLQGEPADERAWLNAYADPAKDMEEVVARVQATDEFRQLAFDEVRLGRRIGQGAYGAVYIGDWQGVKVAVKVITGAMTAEAIAEFRHEALMMAKVSHHPNIVQFIGACVDDERLAMVLRFCDGGALDSALKSGRLDPRAKIRILAEVAGALAFLHSQGVVHRDIAARNVLLTAGDSARLADLGLSRQLEAGADEQSTKSSVGPVRWMAPEALVERKYSGASDAWAFGVLMWEVWSDGATPYGDLFSVADVAVAVVREGRRLDSPAAAPPDHPTLMRQFWAVAPTERPDLERAYSFLIEQVGEVDDEQAGEADDENFEDNKSLRQRTVSEKTTYEAFQTQ